ncbi:MAG: hypothetical protein WCI93_03685 [bacterium]
MNNNPSPAHLVFSADLGFLHGNTKKYKRDALIIKNNDFGSCTPTFHLLSSLAFELFPKVLLGYKVCLKYKDDSSVTEDIIREEISNELKKYNHNIDKLYLNFPELISFLDIKKISSFNNGFVWEYRIELNKGNKHIAIKDIEAVRYGSFAKKRDIMTWCVTDDILIDLLNKIEKYVLLKEREVNEELKKFFN